MAAAQKKVIVRKTDGGLLWAYLAPSSFVQAGRVELMEVDGRVTSIISNEIKTIAYVRDFNRDDPADPERMGRKTFLGRPRIGGLWLRLTFHDNEILEGIADFDLPALHSIADDGGLTLTPPDGRSNTLRVFVPRTALQAIEVMGFVQTGAKKPAASKPSSSLSGDLFGPTEPKP